MFHLNKLYVIPYNNIVSNDDLNNSMFIGIFNGQVMKNKKNTYFATDAIMLGPIQSIIKDVSTCHELSMIEIIDKMLNTCCEYVDGYINYTFDVKNYKSFYNLIEKLSCCNKFVVLSLSEKHRELMTKYGILELKEDSLTKDFELSTEAINIEPSRADHLVELAIAYSIKMYFSKYSFVGPKVDSLTKVYGATSGLNIGKYNIPLEQPIVKQMAKKGYWLVVSDLHYNHAFYYSFDNIFLNYRITQPSIKKYIDPTKHLISFVMSDGDNVSFLSGKIPRMMKQDRNYPLTWTISTEAPKSFYQTLYDFNKNHKDDYYIAAGAMPFDQWPKKIAEEYSDNVMYKLQEHGFELVNEFESAMYNATCIDVSKRTFKYPVMLFNYWNYALNRKPTIKNGYLHLTATDVIMLECDINKVINKEYKNEKYSIIAIGINLINSIDKLTEIINKITLNNDNIEIVNLQDILSSHQFKY